MELLIFLIVLFVVLAGLLFLSRRQAARQRGAQVVLERRHLFTKAELSFLAALDGAVTDQVRAFAKVPLADLLQVPATVPDGERQAATSRLARQQVDFVLCDPGDLQVLAAVEVGGVDRRGRGGETGIEEALASAGIPVIRFPERSAYTVDEVRHKLAPVMPAVPSPAPTARRAKAGKGKGRANRPRDATGAPAAVVAVEPVVAPPLAPERERAEPRGAAREPDEAQPLDAPGVDDAPVPMPVPVAPPAPSAAAAASTVSGTAMTAVRRAQDADAERDRYARLGTCPTCGKPLVERVGKRGALKGKTYLVCSGEPPCAPLATEA